LDSNGDPLPTGAIRRLGTIRFRGSGTRGGVQLSPDGTLLAIDGDGVIRLCEFPTGKEFRRLDRPGEAYSLGCFSPDGKRLATLAPGDSSIHIWDVATLQRIAQLAGHGSWKDKNTFVQTWTMGFAFGPDGNTLTSYGSDRTLRVWDIGLAKEIARHKTDDLEWGPFSPDGKILAKSCRELENRQCYQIELWDPFTCKRILALPRQRDEIFKVAFSPDGRAVALVTAVGNIYVFDVASGQKKCSMITETTAEGKADRSTGPWVAAFSTDGKLLASIRNGSLQLWNAVTGKELRQLKGKVGNSDSVHALFFTPDQKTLVVHEFNALRFWDLTTGRERLAFTGHLARVQQIAFADDGKSLVSTAGDGSVRFWDLSTSRQLRLIQHRDLLSERVSITPDAKFLGTFPDSPREEIRIWNLSAGQILHEFTVKKRGAMPDWSFARAFSPDAKLLATEGDSGGLGEILLWDIAAGELVGSFPVHTFMIYSLAFSQDGKMLASSEHDEDESNKVRLWDVATQKELFALPARKDGAKQVALSPNGKTLATWDDKKILLWEIATRKIVHEFDAAKTHVLTSIHFVPDGRVLALSYAIYQSYNEELRTFGEEELGIVRVWDVRQCKELYAADTRPTIVQYATLSPNGTLLATASSDTSILLWPLQAQVEEKQPLKVLPQRPGRRCNSRPGRGE
jgi:WD40 repeat protein